MRVLIYGLGLIGGSLGLALRRRSAGFEVVGVDWPEVLALPAASEAAHELVDCRDARGVTAALAAAELAVLAVPVAAIRELLPAALEHAGAVTDCGSTKRAICATAAAEPRASRFVPGHPMAGLPEGGLSNARPDLFDGRTWILCPAGSAPDALERVERLLDATGVRISKMSAKEHDWAVARTSHVPQILASALAVLGASSRERARRVRLSSGLTRVAGGAEAMWRDISATNADEIAAALVELGGELDAAREALSRDPPALEPLLALLAKARAERGRG